MRYNMSEFAKFALVVACLNLFIVTTCSYWPKSSESFDTKIVKTEIEYSEFTVQGRPARSGLKKYFSHLVTVNAQHFLQLSEQIVLFAIMFGYRSFPGRLNVAKSLNFIQNR